MDPRVRRADTLIKKNIRRELILDEVAQSFNLSASRLRHMFTDAMGISPTRYLKTLRMRRAKELLETTFLNIKQIRLQVGIGDESHFVRDFKKMYGRSPSRHRAHHLSMELVGGDSAHQSLRPNIHLAKKANG